MNKIFCLVSSVFCISAACAATVVHSPYAKFIENYNSSSFSTGPQIDDHGGIWSYGHRGNARGTALYPFATSKFMRQQSVLGGFTKVYTAGQNTLPYIVVNPTTADVADSGACPKRAATPGNEFIVQPGSIIETAYESKGAAWGVPVIRYTASKAGVYSIKAICETLSRGNDDDGVTSFHILVNGNLLAERDVAHYTEVYTFNETGIMLAKGDYIDFVTACGIVPTKAGKAINYANDSSSVKIEITEEVESVYAMGEDMVATMTSPTPANPFACWSVNSFTRYPGYPYPDMSALTALKPGFNRDTYMAGFSYNGTEDKGQVYCCVNTNTVNASVLSGGASIEPNETLLVPTAGLNVDMRFTTPREGSWKVVAKVRNLQASADSNPATASINVHGLAGGCKLFSRQLGWYAKIESEEFVGYTSRLKAGAYIDLVIDSRGGNATDTTGVKFYVIAVDDSECKMSNAGVALATEMAKKGNATNPFTDSDGVTWEVGRTAGANGTFERMSYYLERVPGLLIGWSPSASAVLPRIQANYNHRLIRGDEKGTDGSNPGITDNGVMYDDEYYIHPNTGSYGVLRYYAPSTGVYKVSATFRDLNSGTASKDPQGVNCHVLANGNIVASGNATFLAKTRNAAMLDPARLYLQANEPIDISVGVDRTTMSDATAVSALIGADGDYEEDFIDVNLVGSSSDTFEGRGRIGWAAPRWNSLTIGSGNVASKDRLRTASWKRTVVSFSISHNSGKALTAASDASQNALIRDGIKSESASDAYTFTIANLTPNASYRLCFYAGDYQNPTAAKFTVGSDSTTTKMSWFRKGINDVALMDVKADGNGVVRGTYASSSETDAVILFGLQIGGTFESASPNGMIILYK